MINKRYIAFIILFLFISCVDKNNNDENNKVPDSKKKLLEAQSLEKTDLELSIYRYNEIIKKYPEESFNTECCTVSFKDYATERIDVLNCYKSRGKDIMYSSKENLVNAIKKQLSSKSSKNLFLTATCDFEVGPCNTDTGTHIHPEIFGKTIKPYLSDVDWNSGFFEYDIVYTVNSKDNKKHSFFLSAEENQWTWYSYCTDDEVILSKFGFENE